MINRILKLLNSREFNTLRNYYSEGTIFGPLNLERKETRHSSFFGWFFNPKTNRALGTAPLEALLRLVATKIDTGNAAIKSLIVKLISGNYTMEIIEDITCEKCTGAINGNNDKDRIYIWTVLKIGYAVGDDNIKEFIVPLAIENKIYSNESDGQTTIYPKSMNCYGERRFPIGILLSPEGNKVHNLFSVPISYQELLDYVIEPLVDNVAESQRLWVESYIRNLSVTINSDSSYTILAVSKKERELVNKFFDLDSDLINAVFVSQFTKTNAVKIIGKECYGRAIDLVNEDSEKLFADVWSVNEELFKTAIFVYHRPKISEFYNIFKASNRSDVKYKVYDKDGNEIFPEKFMKMAKTACAIFKAYLKANPATTLDELRKVFPVTLNDDLHRHYDELFFEYPQECDEGGYEILTRTEGKYKGNEAPAEWDFYLADELLLDVDGKKVICPKKWTASDFARLMEHIQKWDYIKVQVF